MLMLNTYQGFYLYNSQAFGLASAPALLQRRIQSILHGLPRVKM